MVLGLFSPNNLEQPKSPPAVSHNCQGIFNPCTFIGVPFFLSPRPLTNTRERGFAFRMSTRPLWLRGGRWKRPAPVRRRAAAPARAPILHPLTLTVKPPPQRHCSPATLPTAITPSPSSSSRTERHRNGRAVTREPGTFDPLAMPEVMFRQSQSLSTLRK